MKDKADQLMNILADRFQPYVKRRIQEPSKHTHWCLKLALKNLAVVAAHMVLCDHVKEDLRCLGELDELLAVNAAYRFEACSDHPNREGTYLYHDINRGCFIRSGKATSGGFCKRDEEHRKHASSNTSTEKSSFYTLYPSSTSNRHNKTGTKGSFDKLVQYIAAGYEPTSAAAKNLDKDWKEGGLLILSDVEKTRILGSMNSLSPLQKFHNICAYQFELGYDLAIGPTSNVSQSHGFESVLGNCSVKVVAVAAIADNN